MGVASSEPQVDDKGSNTRFFQLEPGLIMKLVLWKVYLALKLLVG